MNKLITDETGQLIAEKLQHMADEYSQSYPSQEQILDRINTLERKLNALLAQLGVTDIQ